MAAPDPHSLGGPRPEFPRLCPTCLPGNPLKTIWRWVLVGGRAPGSRVVTDHPPPAAAQISATIAQHPPKETGWRRAMRAVGLVLLSVATMALLLTDADAQRRSSASQRSPAAAASGSWCA